MNPTDRALKDLIERHVKWPSDLAYIAARDRVREELLSTPAHLQAPRIADVRGVRLQADLRALAAAAIVLIAIGAAIFWPRGPQLYTAGAAGTQVTLEDGSQIEMRADAEMTVERASDGLGIRLHQGDIIVSAAKQRDGHLYVHTTDMTIAVVGTVFLVNAGSDGSRVAVIEGEVRVREAGVETRLRPGEQVATSPTIARRPVAQDVRWSRNADAHIAQLETFMKGMALSAGTLQPLNPGQTAAGSQIPDPGSRILEFEEASIRACDPDNLPPTPAGARGGGANSLYMTPGRTYALCVTTATLIRTAYGYGPGNLIFDDRQLGGMRLDTVYGLGEEDGLRVRGGPDWVRNERYTIEAVAGSAANADMMRGPMLLALLERRFKLKAHVETEQIPAFALTVAPGGPKLTPAAAGSCDELPGRAGAPLIDGRPGSVLTPPRRVEEIRRGQKVSCGMWQERVGPNMVFKAGDVPITALSRQLGGRLGGVRVIDKTGLTDRYTFLLEFAVDQNAPGLPVGELPQRGPVVDAPLAATVFTALEEQLGLRLEPARTPRDFIVIDAIEQPAPN